MTNVADVLDTVYKLVTAGATVGIFGISARILMRIGALDQWMRTTDKEVSSHGTLLQQLTATVNRLLGRAEAKNNLKPGGDP